MKKVHANRLLKLADRLESLPRKDMDMDRYAHKCDESSCGTTACALGWAGLMPEFRKLGLKTFVADSDEELGSVRFVPSATGDVQYCEFADRQYNDAYSDKGEYRGTEAAMRFFGLNYEHAERIFGGAHDGHRTPKQVAQNIRRVVAQTFPDKVKRAGGKLVGA